MTRSTFNDAMAWLQKYHLRTLSAEATELYWKEFVTVDDMVFSHAVEESCRKTSPGRFPTIGELKNVVVEHREVAWQRMKNWESRHPLSKPKGPPKTKELMCLLMHRFNKKITQEELEDAVKKIMTCDIESN